MLYLMSYNPDTGDFAILEKSLWHQENRGRFNPDEGGYPFEIPGGGIDISRPYSEEDIREEGKREILEELEIDEENLEYQDWSGEPQENLTAEEVENYALDGGTLRKMQDGVFHTFYAALFYTSATDFEAISDEHRGFETGNIEDYYDKLGFNEIWALRQFMDPFD